MKVTQPSIPEKPWMNPTLPTEERINLLLAAMTLEEKLGQLWQIPDLQPDYRELVKNGQVGSLLNISAEETQDLQNLAMTETRLGIPLIFGRDVIHGFRTIFPIPLGQAATFDESIAEEAARIAAKEAASQGIHWTFAPMVDICRDPRWGRIAESLGEDPVLAARLGAAMVRGFQGGQPGSPESIAACVKHYVGYGAAEGGRDYNTTLIPDSELRNVYLRPFQACIDAGVLTVMSAFNDLNGIPTSGNRKTIRQMLKGEMDFRGVVVSDWGSVVEMIAHGYCSDEEEAAMRAMEAGVDLEMASECYRKFLQNLVSTGKLNPSLIDDAVRRVLRLKFSMSLFEFPVRQVAQSNLLAPTHLEAAHRAAVRSCVLLKNDSDCLPLDSSSTRVALIGPLADAGAEQIGCWCPDAKPETSITVLTALRQQLGDRLLFSRGLSDARSTDTSEFADAIEAAKSADVAVLCLGEEAILSGEAHSRAYLDLPGAQCELLQAVALTGTPVVVVILAGRPLVLTDILPKANALLYAWHPGTMGGPAIADLLFGKESPTGKLPVSFPAAVGQIPLYYNKRSTGRPAADNARGVPPGTPLNPIGFSSNYLDCDHIPLFPFGFGLTYTSFALENFRLKNNTITRKDSVRISVDVLNTGSREGAELLQLYVRDPAASLTRPVRELKQWKRVHLAAGTKTTVEFLLDPSELSFEDESGEALVENGRFEIGVGFDSACPLSRSFLLKEQT